MSPDMFAELQRLLRTVDAGIELSRHEQRITVCRERLLQRFGLMPSLLSERDDALISEHGDPVLTARFRKQRLRIYRRYVEEFHLEARRIQRERLKTSSASIFKILVLEMRLRYCIAGMRFAGTAHRFGLGQAREVALHFLSLSLPLIYPTTSTVAAGA